MNGLVFEEQADLCSLLLDQTREACALFAIDDAPPRLLWANRACHRLFGIPVSGMIPGYFSEYLPPTSAELFTRTILPQLLRDEGWQGELEAFDGSGGMVLLWADFAPLRLEALAETRPVLLTACDISRHQAAARRACLQEKGESLRLMAESLVHRYSNILAVVLGNLELAREELPPSLRAGSTAGIGRCIDEALHATEQAVKLGSRLRSYLGPDDFRRELFPLHEVCHQVLARPHLVLSAERIIAAFADCPPLTVSAAFDQIGQLIDTLLVNALEATEKGESAVTLRLGRCRHREIAEVNRHPLVQLPVEGELAFIEVSDGGPGIPPGEVERIFDPFYTTKFIGRGLGLAVVLTIVRAHHGSISVDSRPGRGTVFRVYLPLVDSGGQTRQVEDSPAPAGR